jgi:SAM-dependent methyltransferase
MDEKLNIISLNKKAWNNAAEKYNDANYGSLNPLVEFFCNNLPKKGFILDLGSGTGLPFAKLFVEKGFNVLGVDISSQMVKIAKKNVPLANFKELSMTDLDYDKKFDGIFSSYSMLLLSPQLFKDVANRIVKLLKNNGLLYLSLNEPQFEGEDVDKEVIVEIMGVKMYSRAYREEEILTIFSPLGMKPLKIHHEIQTSKEFGIEHMIAFVFKK